METFSALLAICAGNSPVPGEFPTQRPVTRSFDVYFDLSPSKRLSKHSWGWWSETPSSSLWRHRNGVNLSVPGLCFMQAYINPTCATDQGKRLLGVVFIVIGSFLFVTITIQSVYGYISGRLTENAVSCYNAEHIWESVYHFCVRHIIIKQWFPHAVL